jgi:hypothetical protein
LYNKCGFDSSHQLQKHVQVQEIVPCALSIAPPPFVQLEEVFHFRSNLAISTLCAVKKNKYSQHRRFIKSINRLNYLQFTGFNFGRCTSLTLTISEDFIKDKKAIRNALNRVEDMLRAKAVPYYIIVKELGDLHDRQHYHVILCNAPYLDKFEVDKIWRIGTDVKLREIRNVRGGVYYITSYIKKGLNLQWSRGFFKSGYLSNSVYYLVKYDKATRELFINNVWNSPSVSKSDYQKFKGRMTSAEMARFTLDYIKLFWTAPSEILRRLPDISYKQCKEAK